MERGKVPPKLGLVNENISNKINFCVRVYESKQNSVLVPTADGTKKGTSLGRNSKLTLMVYPGRVPIRL